MASSQMDLRCGCKEKALVVTSASLVVTSALLVVTIFAIRNKESID